MNECWNFFKYASLNELDEIYDLVIKNRLWFSHLNKEHFKAKIISKECIYESGVLITFKVIKKSTRLGTYLVRAGNTICEQIIKNKDKSNSEFVIHVFTKFINCAPGSVYLAVNKKNIRAIAFYRDMKMNKVAITKLDYINNNNYLEGYIYKSISRYLKEEIN